MRVIVLTLTENGHPTVVVGVYGPYESLDETNDAAGLMAGVELPVGVELRMGQHRLEDPSELEQRLSTFT